MKSLASDNYSGISLEILQAIQDANRGYAPSYGNDQHTQKAIALFKEALGNKIKVYFVNNGTAANTLALKAITRSHHSIICSDCSHIATQEVGAAANFIGCMLTLIPNQQGKITASQIEETYLSATYWGKHNNLSKVVSIAQTTEYGTVYSINELLDISAVCKKYNLLFHMDGCRLANAAVYLNTSLKEITADVGVDVLSFGGTKNGLLFGEAIIFFREELANEFEYIQKQGLQLQSKMRFLSAQFIPYLEKNLWFSQAKHANDMASRIEKALVKISSVKIAYPVQSNQIFAYFPKNIIETTQKEFSYLVWNQKTSLIRLVTSFDTTTEDIDHFIRLIG